MILITAVKSFERPLDENDETLYFKIITFRVSEYVPH
jgi:hypothetical protein